MSIAHLLFSFCDLLRRQRDAAPGPPIYALFCLEAFINGGVRCGDFSKKAA
jgi:hypothetical protein